MGRTHSNGNEIESAGRLRLYLESTHAWPKRPDTRVITRRTMLAAAPLIGASCRRSDSPYFGKTDPPQRQRLVAVLGVEPGSLDPHLSSELLEDRVIYALFEGLTTLHP